MCRGTSNTCAGYGMHEHMYAFQWPPLSLGEPVVRARIAALLQILAAGLLHVRAAAAAIAASVQPGPGARSVDCAWAHTPR